MKQNLHKNEHVNQHMPNTETEFWIQFWKDAYLKGNTFEDREHSLFMLTTYVKDYYQ